MKIEILVGSNYPDGKEEKRVEPGDVVDVPDKIAKSLIKNNAALKKELEMRMVVLRQIIQKLLKMRRGR